MGGSSAGAVPMAGVPTRPTGGQALSLPPGRPAQVLVREVEENLPVLLGHRMHAGPDVVAEGAGDQLARLRHLLRLQAAGAEEAVDGVGRLEHLELSRRV